MNPSQLEFGSFRIDTVEGTVWCGAERLALRPRPFALLELLVRNTGRLMTHEQLLRIVWSGSSVTPAVLRECVAELRRVLNDTAETPKFIETVSCRGYRFIGPVRTGNLRPPLTTFVGRRAELAAIARLIAHGRLVTLHGPGGVGKTRLAVSVATAIVETMPHGVWWIDLAPLSDRGQVTQQVASVLGVHEHAERSLTDGLAVAIHDRSLLLIFDNCEHLIETCASLSETLLRGCPNLKILATSRQPLRADGEIVWPVPSLALPPASSSQADLLACDASRLFVDRATAVFPPFVLSPASGAAIVEICHRLDGLPLAIELAAARMKVLSPEQVAARLNDIFAMTGEGNRTDGARHQTLRGTFDWSYNLLSPKEQLLFARLAVFAGTFPIEAIESVCGAGEDASPSNSLGTSAELLDLLAGLVDHSLVAIAADAQPEERRYTLIQTVQQYAREKLGPEEARALSARHADYFLRVATDLVRGLEGSSAAECLRRLNREYHDIRAALSWASHEPAGHDIGVQLAAALVPYWFRRGKLSEGLGWLKDMLRVAERAPARDRARAFYGAGMILRSHGDFDSARTYLQQSVSEWRATNDLVGLGQALNGLGFVCGMLKDVDTGERLVNEAADILRRAGYDAEALYSLAQIAVLRGDLARAVTFFEESLAAARPANQWLLSFRLGYLADALFGLGRLDQAETRWHEVLGMLRPFVDDTRPLPGAIEGIAKVICARGEYARAARLVGAADALDETNDVRRHRYWEVAAGWHMHELETNLGAAEFARLRAEGRTLSREEAIALALAPVGSDVKRPTRLVSLPRKVQTRKPRRGHVASAPLSSRADGTTRKRK